jgi:shikimate dehydrogenase
MVSPSPEFLPISGRTRLYGFIGDPVIHARTPQNLNPLFAAAGQDAVIIPVHIDAGRFEAVIPQVMDLRNLDGLVVTMPFKERLIPFLDSISPNARAVNAVNAAKRLPDGTWHGDIFDGAGLVGAARALGLDLSGKRIGLVGAGGAGAAIALSLADAGVARIAVTDLNGARAEALATQLTTRGITAEAGPFRVENLDLLINATPVGMNEGDGIAIDTSGLTSTTAVIDIVTKANTPLAQRARSLGCPFTDGAAMVAAQVKAIYAFFAA